MKSQVQSSPSEPNIKNQQGGQSPRRIEITKWPLVSVRRDEIDWALWLFNGALVLVGFLQWRVLARQADIAHKQELQMIAAGQQTERIIAQMKETEARDLRAYVGISKVILVLQNMLRPTGVVEFQNFGKTPAYNVRQWIGIAPQSHPLTEPLPESTNPSAASVSTIYPSVKNVLKTVLKKELPQGTNVGTPELTIYVYGRVTYDDIFGNHWYTNYRFIFGGPEGGAVYRDDNNFICGSMNPDSEGNDAA